jgi:glutathione synthase/RimK-type ligase-like ATP-grasp enzyme
MHSPRPIAQHIQFLADACGAFGWTLEILDDYSGHLARVSNGRESFLVGAGAVSAFPINNAVAAGVAKDKAHAYAVLARAGFTIPEGQHFFLISAYRELRGPGREIADALDYARQLGFPVFAKPNDGARGDFAELITDSDALLFHLMAMAPRYHCALIQRVVAGPEYRVFVVDGTVMFHYCKVGTYLVGDGLASVETLLHRANVELMARRISPVSPHSLLLRSALASAGLDLGDVPAAGLRIALSQRANLSGGGELAEFSTHADAALTAWAARLAATMDLRVCGIDVIAPDGLGDLSRAVVLEVNSNPSLAGAHAAGHADIVRDILYRVGMAAFADKSSRRA